jgi:endo-1,4-beta-mannosidase
MTFELGVNYWPRRSAMYMWREFDIEEVRDDMARMADMGFDVVRMFALMQDFMPEPLVVASRNVARLEEVAIAAKDTGLKIVPTLIVLNMSGRMWWPDWMLDNIGVPANLYSDPMALRSQELLAATCARALAGDPAIRAFDLTNEIADAQRPTTRDAGRQWAVTIANTIREVAPGTPIQIGAHLPSLTSANNMRVDDLATAADEDVMHAYPLYSEAARSFLDPELVPFSCALTSALSGSGRSTLMQEFGLCTGAREGRGKTIVDDFLGQSISQYLASEDEAASYYEAVLDGLVATGAAGAYAWCYGDYDRRLFDRPPLATAVRERTFGLVRADGSEKRAAGVVRSFRRRRDDGKLVRSEVGIPDVLDVTADEYYRAPSAHFERLYAIWLSRDPS